MFYNFGICREVFFSDNNGHYIILCQTLDPTSLTDPAYSTTTKRTTQCSMIRYYVQNSIQMNLDGALASDVPVGKHFSCTYTIAVGC